MLTVTAEAALAFLWEGYPSLVVDSVVDAGSRGVGNDGSTEVIIASIDSIDSFPVVDGVVEELSIDFIVGAIDDEYLIKSHMVGEVIDRRVDGECADG